MRVRSAVWLTFLLAFSLLLARPIAAAGYPIRQIAALGTLAPGQPGEITQITAATLNDRGEVGYAIVGPLAGEVGPFAGSEVEQVWGWADGRSTLVADPTTFRQGLDDQLLFGVKNLAINEQGEIGFWANLASQGTLVALGRAGAIEFITSGTPRPSPSYEGQDLGSIGPVTFSESGVFTAPIGYSDAFYTNRSGIPEALFDRVDSRARVISDDGQRFQLLEIEYDAHRTASEGSIAFTALVSYWGDGWPEHPGVVVSRPNGDELVAWGGEPAPGLGGASFTGLGNIELGSAGHVLFKADHRDGADDSSGIWLHDPDNGLRAIAISEEPAPGLPGWVFDRSLLTPGFRQLPAYAVNAGGEIALVGGAVAEDPVPGPSSILGIWRSGPNEELQLLAKTGDPVFGGTGWTGTLGLVSNEQGSLQLNDDGRLAFVGFLQGPLRMAVMTAGPGDGVLTAVVSSGDHLPFGPSGETKEVLRISPMPRRRADVDGDQGPTFNNRGEFLFFARFTDGSEGLYLVRIPEPASGLLVAGMLIGLISRRCDRR